MKSLANQILSNPQTILLEGDRPAAERPLAKRVGGLMVFASIALGVSGLAGCSSSAADPNIRASKAYSSLLAASGCEQLFSVSAREIPDEVNGLVTKAEIAAFVEKGDTVGIEKSKCSYRRSGTGPSDFSPAEYVAISNLNDMSQEMIRTKAPASRFAQLCEHAQQIPLRNQAFLESYNLVKTEICARRGDSLKERLADQRAKAENKVSTRTASL